MKNKQLQEELIRRGTNFYTKEQLMNGTGERPCPEGIIKKYIVLPIPEVNSTMAEKQKRELLFKYIKTFYKQHGIEIGEEITY
jgi:hypothetical protein